MFQGRPVQAKLFDIISDAITGAPTFALAPIQLLPSKLREGTCNVQNTLQCVCGAVLPLAVAPVTSAKA